MRVSQYPYKVIDDADFDSIDDSSEDHAASAKLTNKDTITKRCED